MKVAIVLRSTEHQPVSTTIFHKSRVSGLFEQLPCHITELDTCADARNNTHAHTPSDTNSGCPCARVCVVHVCVCVCVRLWGLVGKKPVFPCLQGFFFIPPVVGPEQFFYTFRNDFCAPHDASFFLSPGFRTKERLEMQACAIKNT